MVDLRELLSGVDSLARSVEVLVAHTVRVVVTTVGVTAAAIAILGVCTATRGSLADVVVVVLARVGSQGESLLVGLPDVNLSAASTEVAEARVLVRGGRLPALNVTL